MFDVHLNLRVTLDATARQDFPAQAEIRMISNETENVGRWRLVGRQDHRLPRLGDEWHEWRRDPQDHYCIQLLTGPHAIFARLHEFEKGMAPGHDGVLWAAHLPGGAPPYKMPNAPGWYVGSWKVNPKAHHGNMPTAVMDDNFVATCVSMLNRDTGWRYDTSSSAGFAAGAGAGAGVVRATLVMKRKEDHDHRRWAVVYYAAAVGYTTPGAGGIGSTETTPGGAWTPVMAGVNTTKFSVDDMVGSMVAFEGGVGASAGKGKASAGVGRSTTTFLFFGGVYNDGSLPDISTLKCGFQVWSQSGSANKGGGVSAGMSGFMWVGAATSVTLRK